MKKKNGSSNKATQIVNEQLEVCKNDIQLYEKILTENPNPSKTVEKIHEEIGHLTTLLNEHILQQPLKIAEMEFMALSEDFYHARINEMDYASKAFNKLRKRIVRLLEYKTAVEVLPELHNLKEKATKFHSLATSK